MIKIKSIVLFSFLGFYLAKFSFGQKTNAQILNRLSELDSVLRTYTISQSDSAMANSIKYDSLANEIDDSFHIAMGKLFLGEALEYMALYDSSLKATESAVPVFTKLKDSLNLSTAYNHIGLVLWRMGNLVEASEYHIKAQKIQSSINAIDGKAYSTNFLGMIMRQLQRNNESVKYYRKALKVRKLQNDSVNMAAVFANLGNAKRALGQNDSSLYYQRQALKIHQKQKDVKGVVGVYQNLGTLFMYENELDSSYHYFNRAYEMVLNTNDKFRTEIATYNLGNVLQEMGKPQESIKYMCKSRDLAKEIKDYEGIQYAHEGLYKAYEKTGDFKKSRYHYMRYRDLKDSLTGAKTTERIAEIEEKYQSEQKAAKIKLLKKQDEIKTLKIEKNLAVISRQKRILTITVLISLWLVAAALVLWQWLRQKQKNRLQRQAIAYQKQLLENTVNSQEEERKRIAKELHDGIAQTLSGLKLAFSFLKDKLDFNQQDQMLKYDESLQTLDDACVEIREISHQMMPRVLLESGLIKAIDDMLGKTLKNAQIDYNYEHFGFNDKRLSESIEISLYRISQELVNNIMKHSNANKVEIQLIKSNDNVVLMVEDNGRGFNNKSSDGIGMLNIKSRANTLKGNVNFENLEGSGLVATVRIPITG